MEQIRGNKSVMKYGNCLNYLNAVKQGKEDYIKLFISERKEFTSN